MVAFALVVVTSLASNPILPAPGVDGALDDKMARIEKQYRTFDAPDGLALNASIPDATDRALVAAFVADPSASDFLTFSAAQGTPKNARDVVTVFSGHQGIGLFGGAGVAADAYELLVTHSDDARAHVLAAMDALHVMFAITGVPGSVARGVGHAVDIGAITPTPLDANACPAVGDRANTWRTSNDPALADWVWFDNVSKDQLLGVTLAMSALWDAVRDDPLVDAARKHRMQDDARALGQALMQQVSIDGAQIDLVIRDPCLTKNHDLNPREIPVNGGNTIVVSDTASTRNGFNALLALAIVRALYHVSGDADLGAYYYGELVANRGYPALLTTGGVSLNAMFLDTCLFGSCLETNFSNVNMAWVAMHQLLRTETDPTLRATYAAALESQLYDNGRTHSAKNLPQAYFDVVRAGFVHDGATSSIASEARALLDASPDAPLWDDAIENCDATEIASGTCVANDGTTITMGHGDDVVATTEVPIAVRPHSDFEWRSDPRRVNSAGSDRLFSAVDLRLAYWTGRVVDDTHDSVSAAARAFPDTDPNAGFDLDAGTPASDAGFVDDAGTIPPANDAGEVAVVDAGGAHTGDDAGSIGNGDGNGGGDVDAGSVTTPAHDDGRAQGEGCHCGASMAPEAVVAFGLCALLRRRATTRV